MDWAIATARQDEKHSDFGIRCNLYKRFYGSLVGCSVLMRHTGITCVLRLGNHGVPWCGRWMEFTNGHRFCQYFDVYVIHISDNFNCKILLTDARPEILVRCVIKVWSVDTILTCIFYYSLQQLIPNLLVFVSDDVTHMKNNPVFTFWCTKMAVIYCKKHISFMYWKQFWKSVQNMDC